MEERSGCCMLHIFKEGQRGDRGDPSTVVLCALRHAATLFVFLGITVTSFKTYRQGQSRRRIGHNL